LKELDAFEMFHKNLILNVVFPLLIITIMLVLKTCMQCRKSLVLAREKVICISVVTFWFLQPDICKVLFASLACIDVQGEKRLMYDIDIICWQGKHQLLV
jgi:hypothetical protein